ncbi:GNAT family N-acetyltransferase [Halobacillus fulvus]|nr:GNAT family N-acetyltransferase [Halobacillus fulvus]
MCFNTIQPVQDREKYLPLLLLADEDEQIVRSYLYEGELYALTTDDQTVAAALFTFPEDHTVEIKNIAVEDTHRGQGYGKKVITWAFDHFKNKGYEKMIVGTSNSSIDNLIFYQKVGFRFSDIKKGYFLSYPEPFYEHGIRGFDMIIFEKFLK